MRTNETKTPRRYLPAAIIVFQIFTVFAAASRAADGLSGFPRGAEPADKGSGGRSNAGTASAFPPCGCPDIAFTETFRGKGLGYVHSAEFADALAAVADGKSRFSPPAVPPDWKVAAADWRLHLMAHESGPSSPFDPVLDWERFNLDEEPCPPMLIHLASREYRERPGNGNAKTVLPYDVPTAAAELADMIEIPFARAWKIAAAIARSERLGAATCSPTELSLARAELARARRRVAESHYDGSAVEAALSGADRAASALLAKRQLASSRRALPCYP